MKIWTLFFVILGGVFFQLQAMDQSNRDRLDDSLTRVRQVNELSSCKEISIVNDMGKSALVNEVRKEYFVLDEIGEEATFTFHTTESRHRTTILLALDNDTPYDGMYTIQYYSPRPVRKNFPKELKISQIVANLYHTNNLTMLPHGRRQYSIEDVMVQYKPLSNKVPIIKESPKQLLMHRSQSF